MIKELMCKNKFVDKVSYEWGGFGTSDMPKWTMHIKRRVGGLDKNLLQWIMLRIYNSLFDLFANIHFCKFIYKKI